MTTEAPTSPAAPSSEERMARIEAQQEIIIELLRDHNARFDRIDEKFDRIDDKFDRIDEKFDAMALRIDTINHRIFLAGLGLFTIVGAGVVTYVVNLLV